MATSILMAKLCLKVILILSFRRALIYIYKLRCPRYPHTIRLLKIPDGGHISPNRKTQFARWLERLNAWSNAWRQPKEDFYYAEYILVWLEYELLVYKVKRLIFLLQSLVSIYFVERVIDKEIHKDPDGRHISPSHKTQFVRWLERLKEAFYYAEYILVGLEYELLVYMVKRMVSVHLSIIRNALDAEFVDPAFKRPSPLYTLKKKVLDGQAKTFHDLLGIHNTKSEDTIITGNNSAVTSSFLIDKVFGRDGDRDDIINFLLDKEGDSNGLTKGFSVVAVTGIGGVGKTTLAQYVYNDERVKNHFGVRMWLCVSKKLNVINLLKEMIECASEKECPNLSSLDVLQDMLMETLPKSDNIMVVLDDVWYDNNDEEVGENKWENLLKPLIKFASRGGTCKIVVTSRSTSFPFALLLGKLIELSNLAPKDFISLLRYHAIDDLQIDDPQLKNDLSDMVDKLSLFEPLAPLVAKVVGNQLRERPDIEFWKATLGNVNLSKDGVIAGENLDALQNKLIVPDDVWRIDLALDLAPDDGWFQRDNLLALHETFLGSYLLLCRSYLTLNITRLENGLGTFKNNIFEDNSSWTRSGFRLGVMFKGKGEEEGYFNGERVQEGLSEPFGVIVRQGKVSLRWDLLEPIHEVLRRRKDEKYHSSLLQNNFAKTFADVFKWFFNDESALHKGKEKKEMEMKRLLFSSISVDERDGEEATLLFMHNSSAHLLPREDASAVDKETVELEAEERDDSETEEGKIYDVCVQGEHSVVP